MARVKKMANSELGISIFYIALPYLHSVTKYDQEMLLFTGMSYFSEDLKPYSIKGEILRVLSGKHSDITTFFKPVYLHLFYSGTNVQK